MYSDLPEQLKRVVREHLLANDFQAAKQIHDDWMARSQCANQSCMQPQYYAESC